jgi:deoxyribose-phosphate aldolase
MRRALTAPPQALAMIEAGAGRIGTSQGVPILEQYQSLLAGL